MTKEIPRQPGILDTGIGSFKYELFEIPESERDAGNFPAHVRRRKKTGNYVVEFDKEASDALKQEYASEGLHTDAVDTLYIGTGVIDRVFFERTARDINNQDVLFSAMSSSDELCRQVLGIPGDNDPFERKVLHYLHDELSPGIHRINGLRFATRALIEGNPERLEKLEEEALPHLQERFMLAEPQFIQVARVFTNDVDAARKSFAETVPLHEIAFTFPMRSPQYEAVVDILKKAPKTE